FFGILLGMLLVLFLFHCRCHLALRGGVIGLCRARRTTLRYKRGSPAPIGSATRTHVTGISTRAPRAICYNYHKTAGKASTGAMRLPQMPILIRFFLSFRGIRVEVLLELIGNVLPLVGIRRRRPLPGDI